MKPGLLFLASIAALLSAGAADWPQWRGPNRDGTSAERISTNWPTEGPKVLWRAAVGTGFSSILVSQGRAYTMGNTANQDTIWCFAARTGQELWKHTYPARLDPQYYEGGPGSTPTVDSNRVVTISKWGDVFCLDAARGTVLWQRDLRQDGLKPNRWGFAGSPLLWHDLVILNAGEAGTALDRQTGRIVWCNGPNAGGYASPTLFRAAGRESVLIFAAKHLVALDPKTGGELWRHPWQTDWDTNNTDPLIYRDCIFISSFSHGCALLSVKGGRPEVIYENKALRNNLSPGILVGDYLYAFNGEAKQDTDFRCLHLPSGRLIWMHPEPAFGSLLRVNDSLLVLSEKGDLLLMPLDGSLPAPGAAPGIPTARAKVLAGKCWTPPTLANGLLYVRNAQGELRCLDLEPPGAAK